jgi:hypothetical protein
MKEQTFLNRTLVENSDKTKEEDSQDLPEYDMPELGGMPDDYHEDYGDGEKVETVSKEARVLDESVLKEFEDLVNAHKVLGLERDNNEPRLEDYQKLADRVRGSLEKLLKEESDRLKFGPSYHVVTSAGVPLDIENVFFYTTSGYYGDTLAEKHIFIATDQNGSVNGLRAMTLEHPDGIFDPYIMHGHIATSKRGGGVASALDTAMTDFMQREADKEDRDVIWKVKNQNRVDMEKMKADGASESDLEKKGIEQQRWLSLYGDGGRFGLESKNDYELERTFKPIYEIDEKKPLSDIYLSVNKSSGKVRTAEKPLVSEKDFREEKLRGLAKLLERL